MNQLKPVLASKIDACIAAAGAGVAFSIGCLLGAAPVFAASDSPTAQQATVDQAAPLDILGQNTVRIPPHFRRYVEFSERSSPSSDGLRTIKSFGFDVRYPDWQGLSSPQLLNHFRSDPPERTTWMLVGVNAAENYHGAQALSRLASAMLDGGAAASQSYHRVNEVFGLEHYAVIEADKGAALSSRTFDIYVRRGHGARVETYIRCSKSQFASALCRQYFDLDGEAEVLVQYRRGMLSEWKSIQEGASTLIRGFRSTGR